MYSCYPRCKRGAQTVRCLSGPSLPHNRSGACHRGNARQRTLQRLVVERIVLKCSAQIIIVGRKIEISVSRKAEKYGPRAALFTAHQGLVDRDANGVRRFRSRQYPLRARKQHARLEAGRLTERDRLHPAALDSSADERRNVVGSEASGMERWRDEPMPKGVHPE